MSDEVIFQFRSIGLVTYRFHSTGDFFQAALMLSILGITLVSSPQRTNGWESRIARIKVVPLRGIPPMKMIGFILEAFWFALLDWPTFCVFGAHSCWGNGWLNACWIDDRWKLSRITVRIVNRRVIKHRKGLRITRWYILYGNRRRQVNHSITSGSLDPYLQWIRAREQSTTIPSSLDFPLFQQNRTRTGHWFPGTKIDARVSTNQPIEIVTFDDDGFCKETKQSSENISDDE